MAATRGGGRSQNETSEKDYSVGPEIAVNMPCAKEIAQETARGAGLGGAVGSGIAEAFCSILGPYSQHCRAAAIAGGAAHGAKGGYDKAMNSSRCRPEVPKVLTNPMPAPDFARAKEAPPPKTTVYKNGEFV